MFNKEQSEIRPKPAIWKSFCIKKIKIGVTERLFELRLYFTQFTK